MGDIIVSKCPKLNKKAYISNKIDLVYSYVYHHFDLGLETEILDRF